MTNEAKKKKEAKALLRLQKEGKLPLKNGESIISDKLYDKLKECKKDKKSKMPVENPRGRGRPPKSLSLQQIQP